MTEISRLSITKRAALHRALSDEHRLRIVDALDAGDFTPGELGILTGISSNLLAFHLRVLDDAGIVERRRSEGDSRRRYVHLLPGMQSLAMSSAPIQAKRVAFVCTHNSARSQFAEAAWRSVGGSSVWSAGSEPAARVHPEAVEAARRFGLDLAGMQTKGFGAVPRRVDLVVSVCDRAFESGVPIEGTMMHWSVPDPIERGSDAFPLAFADIAGRIERLRGKVA